MMGNSTVLYEEYLLLETNLYHFFTPSAHQYKNINVCINVFIYNTLAQHSLHTSG